MNQEPTSTSKRPRKRSRQPTVGQLARLGIKVRDFAYESTLQPVRTVSRQPRQIQPGVARLPHQEDTRRTPNQSESGGRPLARVDTEPFVEAEAGPGPSLVREWGGFFQVDGKIDRAHPGSYSQGIQVPIASQSRQDSGPLIPTPTVTPNGSLQWTEPQLQPSSQRDTPAAQMFSHHTTLSDISSPLTPPPLSPGPSRQEQVILSTRSPSMASLEKPSAKRRKIDR